MELFWPSIRLSITDPLPIIYDGSLQKVNRFVHSKRVFFFSFYNTVLARCNGFVSPSESDDLSLDDSTQTTNCAGSLAQFVHRDCGTLNAERFVE